MNTTLMGLQAFTTLGLYESMDGAYLRYKWMKDFPDKTLRAGDVLIIIEEIKSPARFPLWKVLSKFGVMFAIPKNITFNI